MLQAVHMGLERLCLANQSVEALLVAYVSMLWTVTAKRFVKAFALVPQVRNGQLEKEARELRAENSSLLADVENSTQATATSQQVITAVAQCSYLTPV